MAILGYFSQIYALFGAPFTGLNSVVVPQNGQISGMDGYPLDCNDY